MKHTQVNIPPDSGWGNLNGGQIFGARPIDLDRALAFALAGLNRAEAIVVQAVRERSESIRRKKKSGEPWPEPRPARVSLTELARAIDPENQTARLRALRRAKAALLKDRILIESAEGLTLNQNVDAWMRLTGSELAYARAARTDVKGVTGDTIGVSPVTPFTIVRVSPVTPSPLKERARDLDLIQINPEEKSARVCVFVSAEALRRETDEGPRAGTHTQESLSQSQDGSQGTNGEDFADAKDSNAAEATGPQAGERR